MTLAIVVAALRVGVAVERMTLPAFTLTRGDGTSVVSGSLVQQGAWVMIYVAPDCLPCQAILRSIDREAQAALPRRLVIVVAGASAEGLAREAVRYPDLSEAIWLADSANQIPGPIAQAGVPAIIGLRHSTIEWSLSGVLMDPGDVRSILANWLSSLTDALPQP